MVVDRRSQALLVSISGHVLPSLASTDPLLNNQAVSNCQVFLAVVEAGG